MFALYAEAVKFASGARFPGASGTQPFVSKVHAPLHARAPEAYPKVMHVAPPKAFVSHCSVPSLFRFPQLCASAFPCILTSSNFGVANGFVVLKFALYCMKRPFGEVIACPEASV